MSDSYDQLAPGRYVSEHDHFAQLAGTQDLFVAKFVAAKGHGNFTPAQIGAAFDELLSWMRDKKRPAAGEIK